MIRRIVSLAFAVLAVLTATAASAKDKFPLELRVSNEEGKPVEGAAVSVSATSGEPFRIEGVTDRKGRFETRLPDFSRVYEAVVTMEGMATLKRSLDLPATGLKSGQTAEWDLSVHRRGAVDAFNEGVELLRQEGGLPASLPKFEEATAMKPDFLEAWRVLAQLYLEAGQPEKSLGAADRLLQLSANDGTALRARYEALVALGRGADAEAVLDQVATFDHTPEGSRLLFNSGATATNAKETALARKRFEQALAIDPKLHQAHSALAEIHIAETQNLADDAARKAAYAAAVAELDKALAIAPRNFKARERKIEVLRAMGDAAAADAEEKQLAALRAGG